MELKNGHLIIPAALFQDVLQGEPQINMVYYPERSQLLVAAKSKAFFEKLHQPVWMMLKDKNLAGDKALYVRELLIDHDLDAADRALPYSVKETGIIAISL
ncbi:hypothetical protein [Arsenicibacter rosenii]|uniref:Uncharacterized protein n=1 Tax=Arsenicibacter rosenii TaxID=1750698 RepID=A0A1S2VKX2_9BACT|nr:hypothetical protein [Arsenicibacter rosenii]OIN59421.1 hypothetical protein BLX24_10645 [Arsenicibacter rosenii]